MGPAFSAAMATGYCSGRQAPVPIRVCAWRPLGGSPERSGGGGSPCNFAMINPPPGASNPAHPALCTHLSVSRPTRDHCPQQGHLYGVPSLPAVSLGSSQLPGQPDALPEDLKCPCENSRSGRSVPGNAGPPPSTAQPVFTRIENCREVPCRLPLPAPCLPLPPAPGC